jgi:hypothetical protein
MEPNDLGGGGNFWGLPVVGSPTFGKTSCPGFMKTLTGLPKGSFSKPAIGLTTLV